MGLLDKAKSLGAKTVEESKKYAEVTKLNIAISSHEEQIKECKTVIGDIVLQQGLPLQADDSGINEQLVKITELQQKIEEAQKKIKEIKNVCTCDSCGAEITIGEKFCSKCGNRMETPEEVIQEEGGSRKCPECGAETTPDTAFCSNCGQAL